jgi:diacylglycerol kinase family enzyme
MLGYAWAVMRHKHLNRVDVLHGRARQVCISSPEPMPVQMDGEAAGFTPVKAELVPRVLPVLVVP